jgi:hypothetical protein
LHELLQRKQTKAAAADHAQTDFLLHIEIPTS